MSSDTPRQLGRLERSVVHLNRAESSTSYVEFWSWRSSQAWLPSTSKAMGAPIRVAVFERSGRGSATQRRAWQKAADAPAGVAAPAD